MKTAVEIMDTFADDFFTGIIDANVSDVRNYYPSAGDQAWHSAIREVSKFVGQMTEYRKIEDKNERSKTAERLMSSLATLRAVGFFKFSDSSIMKLKMENDQLRRDNRDLARELQWYKEEYPDARPSTFAQV